VIVLGVAIFEASADSPGFVHPLLPVTECSTIDLTDWSPEGVGTEDLVIGWSNATGNSCGNLNKGYIHGLEAGTTHTLDYYYSDSANLTGGGQLIMGTPVESMSDSGVHAYLCDFTVGTPYGQIDLGESTWQFNATTCEEATPTPTPTPSDTPTPSASFASLATGSYTDIAFATTVIASAFCLLVFLLAVWLLMYSLHST
jgi:hypothetical protein